METAHLLDLIKDIESTGIELSLYTKGVISNVKDYGYHSPAQESYLIHVPGILCTMNKEFLYPSKYLQTAPVPSDPPGVFKRGKYKGKQLAEIAVKDMPYLLWALDKPNVIELTPKQQKDIAKWNR